MKTKDFKKTIKLELLAKTGDIDKFLCKSYLSVPLNASKGKILEPWYLYSMGKCRPEFMKLEAKQSEDNLIEYFESSIKSGKWEATEENTQYFDGKNRGMFLDFEDDINMKDISKKVETTIKTTYYMDKKRINQIKGQE